MVDDSTENPVVVECSATLVVVVTTLIISLVSLFSVTIVVISLVVTTAGLVSSALVIVVTTGLVDLTMVSVVVSTTAGAVGLDSVSVPAKLYSKLKHYGNVAGFLVLQKRCAWVATLTQQMLGWIDFYYFNSFIAIYRLRLLTLIATAFKSASMAPMKSQKLVF